jgi:hypothetical protein
MDKVKTGGSGPSRRGGKRGPAGIGKKAAAASSDDEQEILPIPAQDSPLTYYNINNTLAALGSRIRTQPLSANKGLRAFLKLAQDALLTQASSADAVGNEPVVRMLLTLNMIDATTQFEDGAPGFKALDNILNEQIAQINKVYLRVIKTTHSRGGQFRRLLPNRVLQGLIQFFTANPDTLDKKQVGVSDGFIDMLSTFAMLFTPQLATDKDATPQDDDQEAIRELVPTILAVMGEEAEERLMTFVKSHAASDKWEHRFVVFEILDSVLSKEDFAPLVLDSFDIIGEMVEKSMQDSHTAVKFAATKFFSTVVQVSEGALDGLSTIVPHLFALGSDEDSQVSETALEALLTVAAVAADGEMSDLPRDFNEQATALVTSILAKKDAANSLLVRISVFAGQFAHMLSEEEELEAFYSKVAPSLRTFTTNSDDWLAGASAGALSDFGLLLGKEKFAEDSKLVFAVLTKFTAESEHPPVTAFGNMCELYGESMAEHLAKMVPVLVQRASEPYVIVEVAEKTGDEDEDEDEEGQEADIQFEPAAIVKVNQAFKHIRKAAKFCGAKFAPFVETVLPIITRTLSNYIKLVKDAGDVPDPVVPKVCKALAPLVISLDLASGEEAKASEKNVILVQQLVVYSLYETLKAMPQNGGSASLHSLSAIATECRATFLESAGVKISDIITKITKRVDELIKQTTQIEQMLQSAEDMGGDVESLFEFLPAAENFVYEVVEELRELAKKNSAALLPTLRAIIKVYSDRVKAMIAKSRAGPAKRGGRGGKRSAPAKKAAPSLFSESGLELSWGLSVIAVLAEADPAFASNADTIAFGMDQALNVTLAEEAGSNVRTAAIMLFGAFAKVVPAAISGRAADVLEIVQAGLEAEAGGAGLAGGDDDEDDEDMGMDPGFGAGDDEAAQLHDVAVAALGNILRYVPEDNFPESKDTLIEVYLQHVAALEEVEDIETNLSIIEFGIANWADAKGQLNEALEELEMKPFWKDAENKPIGDKIKALRDTISK